MATSSENKSQSGISSGFTKGSIVRIKMENFRTFVSHEYFPAPGGNIIYGGHGKTTILVGIALGLGGKPSVACVKRSMCNQIYLDSPTATIEIELAYAPTNYVVRRTIRRDADSSLWELNGEPVGKEQIRNLMHELNIELKGKNGLKFAQPLHSPGKILLNPTRLMSKTLKTLNHSFEWVGKKAEVRGLDEEIQNLEGAEPVANEDVNKEKIELKKLQREKVKASLLADLAPLIDRINSKFGKWMKEIGLQGEIFAETGKDWVCI